MRPSRAAQPGEVQGFENRALIWSRQRLAAASDRPPSGTMPPMKMYILVRDDIRLGFAMVAVAPRIWDKSPVGGR